MSALIVSSLIWWAAEIAAFVLIGYKAAAFGVLMSLCTAAMIGWMMKDGE